MTQQYDKLKALLLELFQLNQPDLDFGLRRLLLAVWISLRDSITGGSAEAGGAGLRNRSIGPSGSCFDFVCHL